MSEALRWRQVRALFDQLAESDPTDWSATLDRACPDDPELRDEVLAMLRADADAQNQRSLIAGHAPELIDGIAAQDEARQGDRWIGRQLGSWRIVRVIGHGGMGRVYLAERDQGGFRQPAALKLLRNNDSPGHIDRFLAERQILAELVHPGIARLIDGGSCEEAGPWFALEHVDGVSLGQWCDQQRLDVNRRLKLFLDVCAAVAYAHARLVIHRDLKPSNILVDGEQRVKLLDFGIAKLIDAEAEQTGTALRAFTPEYAAPEQVRGERATTAVDVYALGVILYELLTGQRPYRVAHESGLAYEQAVVNQRPDRPSASFSRTATSAPASGGDDTRRRAALRSQDPMTLQSRLRGDLDAIVLKALRKEPEKRYASVRELALDIEAFLARRPVTARRGGWRYVAGRFVRRNLMATAMAALAVAALAIGLILTMVQAETARTQRDLAREEAEKSRQVLGFMTSLFANADPGERGRADLSARDLLDEGTRSIRYTMVEQKLARMELLLAMAAAYSGLQLNDQAKPLIDEARSIAQEAGDVRGDAEATLLDCVHLMSMRHDEQCLQLSLAAEQTLDERDPRDALLISRLIQVRHPVRWNRMDDEVLIAEGRRGVALLGDSPQHLVERAYHINYFGNALVRSGRREEGEALMDGMLDALRRSNEVSPRDLAIALGWKAFALNTSDRMAEKVSLNREALAAMESLYGPDQPILVTFMNNLAVSLRAIDELDASLDLFERAVQLRKANDPPDSPWITLAMGNLGNALFASGQDERALAVLDEAIDRYEQHEPNNRMGSDLTWRGAVHLAGGRLEPARADLERSRQIYTASGVALDHRHFLRTRAMQVSVLLADGEVANPEVCTEAQTISTASDLDDRGASDAALARFLANIACASREDSTTRSIALQELGAEVPVHDFRLRLADRVLQGQRGRTGSAGAQ